MLGLVTDHSEDAVHRLESIPTPRVFCIGRNYRAHIRELDSPEPEECVVFLKPASSLVPAGEAVRLPRGRGAVHHEAEVVVALGLGGREIPRERALSHVAGLTLGLDLTLRDLQAKLKAGGLPWELSKAFDQSAPLGELQPWEPGTGLSDLSFRCEVNGEVRQEGNIRDLLFPVDRLIAILSQTWELRAGDLIFTGTPAGVGPVVPGDAVTVSSPRLGSYRWEFL